MSDIAHKETDKIIEKAEKKIHKVYSRAEKETKKKLDEYLAAFERKDEAKRLQLAQGLITQEEYAKWRTGQICIGKRWREMLDTLATDLTNADKLAMSVANGYMPEVYALNHNYATFQVEKGSLVDTSYTLYDKQTVERLVKGDPKLLPKARVDIPKDKRWNRRHIKDEITQGILQGEDLRKISKRLKNVTDMDNRAAIRNARTIMTGAENAGRVDSYKRAQDLGIELEQEWLATLDGRTRHSHRQLDGERRPVGKKFSNGCRFPGDPDGDPSEVYNCRCTLIAAVKGVDTSDAERFSRLEDMSYDKWKKGRK